MVLPITNTETSVGSVFFEADSLCPVHHLDTNRNCALRTANTPEVCYDSEKLHMVKLNVPAWRYCWQKIPRSPIRQQDDCWGYMKTPCETGDGVGSSKVSPCKTSRGRGVPRFFPPHQIASVKAVACELPAQHRQPLSRLYVPDIQRIVIAEKHIESISRATIWRILDRDALKPWRHHSWIWSRDPFFFQRAAPVLDLYQGFWQERSLRKDDFVLSADEKTSIQARIRLHSTEVCADNRGQRVEHEYERGGAWAYLAAWDVHRAKIFGRVEKSTGIAPFDRLIAQVMHCEPYASAHRVFWIVDQGSSHRPTTFPDRLRNQFPNAVAVMLPVHASWLNQIEIYFSILQRKVLTPNDFPNLAAVAKRIHAFGKFFMRTAEPFKWNFTRHNLRDLLKRVSSAATTFDTVQPLRGRHLGATG